MAVPHPAGGTPTEVGAGYAKGRARRRAIIQTASQHFGRRGFTAATILEIAAACGISRAGLLHYFPSKEALLLAVLEDRDAQDRARFHPYVGIRGGMGILRGMVDLADHNALVPGLIDLFVRLSAEASDPAHPAHAYFRKRYGRIRSSTARALRSAAEAGYLRSGVEPYQAAVRLTAVMDGLQIQWLLDPQINMAQQLHAAINELLTDAGSLAFETAVPSPSTTE
jgi:AcrR family transcriptional regulator